MGDEKLKVLGDVWPWDIIREVKPASVYDDHKRLFKIVNNFFSGGRLSTADIFVSLLVRNV